VLFGGRPLPERPFWVRALTVVALLGLIIPLARSAYRHLPLFWPKRDTLTAEQTAAALPRHLPYRPFDAKGRDIRCEANAGSNGSPNPPWDFICTFVPNPDASSKRLKVGVSVRADQIAHVSRPEELDARRIRSH
jgi:hypothetical protein